jgi:sortase A
VLLRPGLILATFSILLAAGLALVVNLRTGPPAVQNTQTEPLTAETATQENDFDPGKKLEIDDGPGEDLPRGKPNPRSESMPRDEKPPSQGGKSLLQERKYTPSEEGSASGQRALESLPVSNPADWAPPTRAELRRLVQPRYFDPDPDATMTLTVEALGLYDVPVIDSYNEEVLSQGVMHVPDTAFPWDRSKQKNVFLAGHRVGLPGTDGRLLFFNLDQLSSGDTVVLKDHSGNAYKYRVTDIFKVGPRDAWVADTLVGRDLLTLQTCTYPTFEERLIVRADRA